jgi:hypothetical protein
MYSTSAAPASSARAGAWNAGTGAEWPCQQHTERDLKGLHQRHRPSQQKPQGLIERKRPQDRLAAEAGGPGAVSRQTQSRNRIGHQRIVLLKRPARAFGQRRRCPRLKLPPFAACYQSSSAHHGPPRPDPKFSPRNTRNNTKEEKPLICFLFFLFFFSCISCVSW